MNFELLTDEQILHAMGEQFESLRLQKQIPDKDIQDKGGIGKDAIDKLRNQRGNITLISLIRILRGLGELERLEKLLSSNTEYSPSKQQKPLKKRIFKKSAKASTEFKWGDES
ncbi:hypothetical protein QX776_10460 [Alteromonadaceae bacterium BrNp21-10]|nr:hypothetical protein [Alteromonadaceae bacterium BrNp21-10]